MKLAHLDKSVPHLSMVMANALVFQQASDKTGERVQKAHLENVVLEEYHGIPLRRTIILAVYLP